MILLGNFGCMFIKNNTTLLLQRICAYVLRLKPTVGYPLMQVPRRGSLADKHKTYEAHYKEKYTWYKQQQTAGDIHEQGGSQYQEEQAATR